MLTIFRRHVKACPHRSRRYRRCSCPIWIEGSIGEERVPRKALNQTSWEAAEEYVRESNKTGKLGGAVFKLTTISEAVELYLQDVGARVRASTVRLHRVLLKDSLLPWCEDKGLRYLKELDVKVMIAYRASWTYAPLTALKKFERLRSFFRFCFKAGWMPVNPMEALKAPKADTPPTLPFSDEEIDRIIEAARTFKIRGSYGRKNAIRVLAFVYVLRYSGLRISDAAGLAKERLTADGKLFLHMQHKTKVPVFVPLPPFVVSVLREQGEQSVHPDYFFWTAVGTIESACSSWKRTLYRIYELANVKEGHAHRFRDTFATALLLKGVPLETVSQLLGHRSTKVTEESYSPWIKARQDQLEAAVRATWPDEKPKLKVIQGGA
jgi:integrase/recombinase XerD